MKSSYQEWSRAPGALRKTYEMPIDLGRTASAEHVTSYMKTESKRMRVLHLISYSHITAGYFDFLQGIPVDDVAHIALVPPGDHAWMPTSQLSIVRPRNRFSWLLHYLRLAAKSQKILVHGIAGGWTTLGLAIAPWALGKVFWLIWGADLYHYRRRNDSRASRAIEVLRRFVIGRIGHLVTYLDGDVELARTWYKATGQTHQCLLYPGNTFQTEVIRDPKSGPLRVQVGHSADPENHHDEIFKLIAPLGDTFAVVAPLAYGDPEYCEKVLTSGRLLFEDRFFPQLRLVPLSDYLEQLESIDIAIFNHRRQQAMGNTITLLGMGKRVFIRKSTSQWELLRGGGVHVSAIEDGINLARLSKTVSEKNVRLISELFSPELLAKQWRAILNG